MQLKNIGCILMIFLIISCQNSNNSYLPKPRLYPKVNYPTKVYEDFDASYCSFTFQKPEYAQVVQDKYFFDEKPVDPCWFDLNIDTLNSTLHCSYIPVLDRAHFDKLIGDSFRMIGEHNKKADYREDQLILNAQGVQGILFEVDGPVASPLQFFLTDSTTHFLRASLYFNSTVNPDSIAPVYEFVKEDVFKMISSFEWIED